MALVQHWRKTRGALRPPKGCPGGQGELRVAKEGQEKRFLVLTVSHGYWRGV